MTIFLFLFLLFIQFPFYSLKSLQFFSHCSIVKNTRAYQIAQSYEANDLFFPTGVVQSIDQ